MATVSLVPRRDGFIQYIDKVLANRSANSKKLKVSNRNEQGNTDLHTHIYRSRRHIFNDKADACKALEITSAVAGGAANVASAATSAASSIPFFAGPAAVISSKIAIASFAAQAAADVAYITMDCSSIPFDEIKKIMDKRFNNLDKAVDRNYAALQEVFKLVSKTLTSVEQTRIEMHQGFNQVLASIKSIEDSQIQDVLSELNSFIRYFDINKDQIISLSRENYNTQINVTNNALSYLNDLRTPEGERLYFPIKKIVRGKIAIPSDADDIIGVSALYSLYYGTQTYISVLFFLIEQHSYIADYYYQNGDLKKFNEHFGKIQEIFENFRSKLVGKGDIKGLIDIVINIMTEVQAIDFITDDRVLSESLTEKLEELDKLNDRILEMELPIVVETPGKFSGKITFKLPSVTTPSGEWKDGKRVYYAMQYKNGDKYSKLGAWSEPLIVHGEANPILRFPVDPRRMTRLIYRKFNENNPELVGIIEDKYLTEYRDVDRDLYNAASWTNEHEAVNVINTLLRNGANSTAIFDQGRRALHSAAEGGNSKVATEMLKSSDINIRDDNGYTPLHIAAEAGHDDLVKFLVKKGANINVQTFAEELTPIHLAARKGYVSTVKSLMDFKGIDMNLGDNEGFTPFHSAVTGGLLIVKAILFDKSVDINGKSNKGLSALHLTAMNNYMDIAEELLKYDNLNMNIEAEGKMTPLHFATISGHFDMVQFLQNNGANINVKDATNWTPLHYAISLKKEDIALELLKSRVIDLNPKAEHNITPMHIACGSGQVRIVQKILEKIPSHIVQEILSTKTKDGLTPLHIATMKKYRDIVTILFDNGADIEAKTNQGLTPLLAAAASGKIDIVNYLYKKKADVKAVDVKGNSVINLAAENGHLHVVKYFVEDWNFSLMKGESVIMSAIPNGHLNIIKYLVDDKGVTFSNNDTMYVASKYGNVSIVVYIASKYTTDLSELSLSTAVNYGHLNLVKNIIEKKGTALTKYEGIKGKIHDAVKYGWLGIVKYLHGKFNLALDLLLETAICSGNIYLVKYLMENIETNALTRTLKEIVDSKYSLLHSAVAGPTGIGLNDKHVSYVLRYFVDEKNCDVNAQTIFGRTPLHDAVFMESFYPIKFLISRGADIHMRDIYDRTPLDLAIKFEKSVEIQEFLQMQDVCNSILENEVPKINHDYNVTVKCVDVTKGFTDDVYQTTALHLALNTGAIDTVKLLVTRGANVNSRDEEGNLPLHFAVQNGNVELVKTLIHSGADVTLKNLDNQTPKDVAKENHAMNIVELLMQAQLHQNRGRVKRVKKSINQEASLDTKSSSSPHYNILTYIIEEGCSNSGATPLCLSSSSDNQDLIDVRSAQCLDSNVSLGLLLAQNFLNKKFPLPNFSHVTPVEARAIALTISKKFEKLLKKYTKNAGDFDFYQLYVDIEADIKNEKFSNVPNVLLEFAKNVCGKVAVTVSGKIANMFPKM